MWTKMYSSDIIILMLVMYDYIYYMHDVWVYITCNHILNIFSVNIMSTIAVASTINSESTFSLGYFFS